MGQATEETKLRENKLSSIERTLNKFEFRE